MQRQHREHLYYVTLEPYKARYTEYVSGHKGTYMSQFNAFNIPVTIVTGDDDPVTVSSKEITHGSVVDAGSRTTYSFNQIKKLVSMILAGNLDPQDYIYFEDFWTPGMDALMYALCTAYGPNKENWPGIGGFWHAQTVDMHDFTASWATYMRPFEIAYLNMYTDLFVATQEMTLLIKKAKLPIKNVYDVGLPFVSAHIKAKIPIPTNRIKENIVVFSSRWDTEKDPGFFMDVIETYLEMFPLSETKFVICSGHAKPIVNGIIKTNDIALSTRLEALKQMHPNNVVVRTGLSKREYYEQLSISKISFNCAFQDLISYTLLESSMFGCHPLYPNYFTFPATLGWRQELMHNRDVNECAEKIADMLRWSPTSYSWIHEKCDAMPQRVLHKAGFNVGDPGSYQDACDRYKVNRKKKAGTK